MTEIIVREVQMDDALGVLHLYSHWGIEKTKKKLKKSIESDREFRLVAIHENNIAGHIFAKYGSVHHAHIATFYSLNVSPEKQGQGIASMLFGKALESLPASIKIVTLQMQHDNDSAKKLFKKFDFVQYGYLANAFKKGEETKDNILMKKAVH